MTRNRFLSRYSMLLGVLVIAVPSISYAAEWFVAGSSAKMDTLVFVDASSLKRSDGKVVFWNWVISEGQAKNYKVLREIHCASGKTRNIQISAYEKDVHVDTFKGSGEDYIVPGSMDYAVMKSVCSQAKHKTHSDVSYQGTQDFFANQSAK